jgi:hypothetical protein
MVESAYIAAFTFIPRTTNTHLTYGSPQTFLANFSIFDSAIANDTQLNFTQPLKGSWILSIYNDLNFSMLNETQTEAQVAIAPIGPTEALSIPTLIIQERADGLLRIEYFAQNWPNTYGLVLYNATRSDLFGRESNISLIFTGYGAPSPINPELAPRSNGNLTIYSGTTILIANYPIAWASLDSVYFYGLVGSHFNSGNLTIEARSIQITS